MHYIPRALQPHAKKIENRLLGSLPEPALRALEANLEHVRLPLGKSLYEPGEPLNYVFFPSSGIVSLIHVSESGASAGLTVVGSEGMIGIAPLLGGRTATTRAVAQAAGGAYRLRVEHAKAAFAEDAAFQALVLQYAHRLILELSQSAVCNLHHTVEQQLCRLLLLCLDRLQGGDIEMTHELIANLLGVRRQSVTEAAKRLQERGIVTYARRRLKVLDRSALELCACECYGLLAGPAHLRPVSP